MRGHWFALQANRWFFYERKPQKIELVTSLVAPLRIVNRLWSANRKGRLNQMKQQVFNIVCFAIKLYMFQIVQTGLYFQNKPFSNRALLTNAIHTQRYDSKYPMFLSPNFFICQFYSCFEKIILPALRCICLDMKESNALWKFRRLSVRDLDSGLTVSLHITLN